MTLCTCSVFSGYVWIWTACEHTQPSHQMQPSRQVPTVPMAPFLLAKCLHGETNATPYPIRLDASTCLLPKKSSLPKLSDVQHRHKSLVELIGSIHLESQIKRDITWHTDGIIFAIWMSIWWLNLLLTLGDWDYTYYCIHIDYPVFLL